MRVVRYSSEWAAAWDRHVDAARNGHFFFKRGYMEYHSDRFADHSLLFLDDRDRILAALPANESADRVLWSHQGLTFGGLLLSQKVRAGEVLDAFARLRDYLRAHGLPRLRYKAIPSIYHALPSQEDRYALFRNDAICDRVDLSIAIDLSGPWRPNPGKRGGARKAGKLGVEVEASRDFDAFFSMATARLAERYDALSVHSAAEMALLSERFPEQITLHLAQHEGEVLAGVLLFRTSTVWHTQYMSSTEKGRRMRALDLVVVELLEAAQGVVRFFDFGISNEDAGRILNETLCRQKEEFGGSGVVHEFFTLEP